MEGVEDQEVLFHAYQCPYYVQSPSTISHANSTDVRNPPDSTFHSPIQSGQFITNHVPIHPTNSDASRITLSHYSSRGSNHSFLREKRIPYDAGSHYTGTDNGETRLIVVGSSDGDDDHACRRDDDEEDAFYEKNNRGLWKKYFTYRNSDPCPWICLQLCWRAMVSMGIALLVFYITTKPPSPKLSVKVAGIHDFKLGEGVDHTGVATKILTCNCSIGLLVENKSKLFGLHINPPFVEMSFGHLSFATSYGKKLYAESGSTLFRLYVGTNNKPMYGAGRSMDDMLESGEGLALTIRVNLKSSFRVVWNFIMPKFHHHAECSLVLGKTYDKKHHTQAYHSTCKFNS